MDKRIKLTFDEWVDELGFEKQCNKIYTIDKKYLYLIYKKGLLKMGGLKK